MPPKKTKPKSVSLNPEQQAVVGARDGIFKILAGPGSGKSTCLVQRYVRLVESGIEPQSILSLTFTNAAATSMRKRAESLHPVQKMDRTSGWMTFHGLALAFCTQEREHFPFKLADFPLATEPIANKITGEVARKFELDPRSLRPWISLQKRNRIRPVTALRTAEKEGTREKLALAYKMYDSKLREMGVLDFDGLLFEMVELLSCAPRGQETTDRFALTKRWQYQFIQCDESQDNDPIQWSLIHLMSLEHTNIMCVGDAGQNLYSFRGSSGEMFMNMSDRWGDVQTLYLAKNHRSSPQVVSLCKQCAPYPELGEKFYTENADGPDPEIVGYPSAVDEAQGVIIRLGTVDKNNTCAVLSRTNRALRPIEDAFSVAGIKYHLLGKSGFWAQPEVRSCLAYLQCSIFPSDAAVMGAFRAPFHPSAYIKKAEVAAKVKGKPEDMTVVQFMSRMPEDRVRSFVHFLDTLRRYRDLPPHTALTNVIRDVRALDYYKEEETTPDNSPVENIQELGKIAQRFSSVKEFLDYTRRVSAASKSKTGVCLSTIHSSKGTEHDKVFVVAVQDGILPHAKAESIDDERNCFFVAISRPRTYLHISYSGSPSIFLRPFIKAAEISELDEVFT